ncbi:MAG: hypothetical protein U5K27_04955 [Desulfotignum sp.]|nr:hypothetical protein [Desulfotignum sp.]
MPYDKKHLDLQQLRKKAERIVDERKEETFEKSESDISDMVRLIHELEVYQEEVETSKPGAET